MSDVSDSLLTAVLAYGAPALGLVLLLAALGIPLPATLLLLASGAFARQGMLDAPLAVELGWLGSVLGDSGSYCLGRCGGALIFKHVAGRVSWQQARVSFERRGALAIFLTRFLLTPLALPTNLIAGSSEYDYGRFLILDVVGEAVWIALYGGLGYLFADQWEALNDLAGNLTGTVLGLFALMLGGVVANRALQRRGLPRIAAAAEQHVTLVADLPAQLPLVLADSDRVRQVLHNLVANALRYTPAGGTITLRARIEERGLRTEPVEHQASPLSPQSSVLFTVEDTGQGIAAPDLPHVFERFWRADRSRSREHGGSGLGLAIARQIVAAHGGQIGVTSRIGVGSQFWFRLSVAEPPALFSASAHQINQSSNAR